MTRRSAFTARLARLCGRKTWVVVGVWAAVLAVAAVGYSALRSAFQSQDSFMNAPESKRALQLMQKHLPSADRDTEVVVVGSRTAVVNDAAFKRRVASLRSGLLALDDEVVSVVTPYDAPEALRPFLISEDRHTALLPTVLAGDLHAAQGQVGGILRLVRSADGVDGFTTVVTGAGTWGHEANELAGSDLRRAELIGVPAALLILVLVFGSLVAALLPLALAGAAILIASAFTALLGQTFSLSVFALNIITGMGLAVGIDYSLFIISRFREERSLGVPGIDAVTRTGATANRAMFFSGMTVVFSLLGMLIVPYSIFTSLGAGAISVVLIAVAAALTLLPALLGLLGDRVNALPLRRLGRKPREDGVSRWAAVASLIMRRPALSLALAVVLLLALAAPAFSMRTGASGLAYLPDRLSSKRGFDMLSQQFSAGWTAPAQVVIDGPLLNPSVVAALGRFRSELISDGRFRTVGLQVAPSGTLAVLTLIQDEAPTSEQALANVRDLRARLIPAAFGGTAARALVGGATAGWVDGLHMIAVYQPVVIGLVLALSFVLLLVAFHSVVVAASCIVMNLLSVGASYGAMVLVFQHGLGHALFGFTRVDTIEAWIPLLMFCILFGLSMDYQVFLLSRIRERYDHSGDTREAVSFGVQSTAGLITGAALIMVAVFAGLASGELVMFQQLGLGLAVAVLLDATLVRTVVAPAIIAIIGRSYWWLPRRLAWLPAILPAEPATGAAGASPDSIVGLGGAPSGLRSSPDREPPQDLGQA